MTEHQRLIAAAHAFLRGHHLGENLQDCMRDALRTYNSREADDKRPVVAPKWAYEIQDAVARKHGVTVDGMCGRDTWAVYQRPRREIAWLLHQCDLSFPVIAMIVKRGDHTTILSLCRRFERDMEHDAELAAEMKRTLERARRRADAGDSPADFKLVAAG